jgi:septum formation protein
VAFVAAAPQVEEVAAGDPEALVRENALRKARAVGGARVLGVDTTVALGGRVFGKPPDEEQARGFLDQLAGRTHEVWSGIALVAGSTERVGAASTRVTFRALSCAERAWYVATGEWRERAGGYAIQGRGAALVEGIEGDYLNVVGLPVAELVRMAPDLFGGA